MVNAGSRDKDLAWMRACAADRGAELDIIERSDLAMIAVQGCIETEKLATKLIMQVHDELVLEAAPEALDQVLSLTRETMERAVELSVPLLVETGVGPNWMEAK